MTEIKIRAWDKKTQKMWIPADLYIISATRLFCTIDGKHNLPDLVFMQFTGLKDKNDVEIYDGDVVKDQFGQGVVIRHPGYFSACGSILGVDAFSQSDMTLEVIGNIYKNPELL